MKIIQLTLILFCSIIIYSCKNPDPNQHIDEGIIQNDVYESKEIGWKMNIPKGWDIVTRDQSDEVEQKGLKAIQETTGQEYDISGLKDLISFKKNRFNVFASTSEPFELEYEGEWEENNSALKQVIYETYRNQGIRTDSSETKNEKIDGLEFRYYTFTIYSPKNDTILKQIFYSRLINGFDFGAIINYNNTVDKNEMLTNWRNSKFSKK